jgi:hypothetical protein
MTEPVVPYNPKLPVANDGCGLAEIAFIMNIWKNHGGKTRLKLSATGVYWHC